MKDPLPALSAVKESFTAYPDSRPLSPAAPMRPNVAFGAPLLPPPPPSTETLRVQPRFHAPNATLGASNAPNATLGRWTAGEADAVKGSFTGGEP
ncbi:hypothetical protein GCM10023192_73750 [Amycolatopsis samaneae]